VSILTTATTLPDGVIEDAVARIAADGYAIVPGVLDAAQCAEVLDRLWAGAAECDRRGLRTRAEQLDPNEHNVRVWNLLDLDPVFVELIQHPVADALVGAVLGADYIISNFTANIARPGSGSMSVHSDQSLVVPPPWDRAHCINIIWCVTEMRPENGATLHVPGSHRCRTREELPDDLAARLVPFEAPAGSIVAMEGRVWHTSGRNVTVSEDRALLFGFYCQPFVRPQWNWSVGLSPATQAGFDATMRYRLGLDLSLNTGYAAAVL
jgi:ectoine hydroxylase-related dioxygenase (phytanoyl-CoA dioxygenase family)